MLPNPPYNQFVMISDRTGMTRANFDPHSMKRIAALANYYPETMGAIYVLGANWLFHLIHKFVSTFLDPVTMGKMKLLDSLQDLQHCVDVQQLLQEYGGPKQVTSTEIDELDLS